MIIGGSGFLGAELVRRAVSAGRRPAATFHSRPGNGDGAAWHHLDLRDPAGLEEVLDIVAPAAVINATSGERTGRSPPRAVSASAEPRPSAASAWCTSPATRSSPALSAVLIWPLLCEAHGLISPCACGIPAGCETRVDGQSSGSCSSVLHAPNPLSMGDRCGAWSPSSRSDDVLDQADRVLLTRCAGSVQIVPRPRRGGTPVRFTSESEVFLVPPN